MKRKTLLPTLALAAICLIATDLTAQNRNRQYNRYADDEPESGAFAVGIAPISLLSGGGKFNVRGEWAYASNKSLSLLVGIPKKTDVPGFYDDKVVVTPESGETASEKTTSESFRSFGAVLENRFYFGKQGAPRGFYLAPYLRYNRFALTHTIENESTGYETNITGAVGGFGFGGSLGAQFKIAGPVTMDITILGLDLKWMRGSLTYQSDDPNNDVVAYRDKIVKELEDVPFIGNRLANQIDGDKVRVRTPGVPLPGVRFNLTVNYVF